MYLHTKFLIMKKNTLLLSTAIIVILNGCNSTRIISSWREPNKEVVINKLNKVLVVALFKDETSRRKAEDEMVNYLDGKGVVSYNYLNDNFNKKDEEAIRQKIKADGFDGAVTMRLIDVEKEKVYTPGNAALYPTYYRNFSGYFYRNWSYYSTPGYYSTTKVYKVETNVFSIKEDKIIWSGLTETTNPGGVKRLTEEITHVVYKAMVKEGFIK